MVGFVVAGAVDDDAGPPIVVGLLPGGANVNDDVALADALLNEDPLKEAETLLDEPLNEDDALEEILLDVEFKKDEVLVVEGNDEVRFAGRLVTIVVEDVAEVDSVVVLAGADEVLCILVTVDTTVEL